ncbi:hypothetical protein BASA60_006498 [Batrachochytrium salamandrivorans]|nr:hypothetical protein BASA60_006498 [Batrachochytrium salamandrivorans]
MAQYIRFATTDDLVYALMDLHSEILLQSHKQPINQAQSARLRARLALVNEELSACEADLVRPSASLEAALYQLHSLLQQIKVFYMRYIDAVWPLTVIASTNDRFEFLRLTLSLEAVAGGLGLPLSAVEGLSMTPQDNMASMQDILGIQRRSADIHASGEQISKGPLSKDAFMQRVNNEISFLKTQVRHHAHIRSLLQIQTSSICIETDPALVVLGTGRHGTTFLATYAMVRPVEPIHHAYTDIDGQGGSGAYTSTNPTSQGNASLTSGSEIKRSPSPVRPLRISPPPTAVPITTTIAAETPSHTTRVLSDIPSMAKTDGLSEDAAELDTSVTVAAATTTAAATTAATATTTGRVSPSNRTVSLTPSPGTPQLDMFKVAVKTLVVPWSPDLEYDLVRNIEKYHLTSPKLSGLFVPCIGVAHDNITCSIVSEYMPLRSIADWIGDGGGNHGQRALATAPGAFISNTTVGLATESSLGMASTFISDEAETSQARLTQRDSSNLSDPYARSALAELVQQQPSTMMHGADLFRQILSRPVPAAMSLDIDPLPPMRMQKLTLRQRYSIVKSLATCMMVLHDENLLYRDLCSANVFSDAGCSFVRLADIGIAECVRRQAGASPRSPFLPDGSRRT